MEQFAWGLMSPHKIQHLMSLAKEDLIAHANGTLDWAEVEALSSVGASGTACNNSFRDLQRKLAEPKLAAASHVFMLPMKSPICRHVVSDYPQTLLLPHTTFSIMYHTYPAEFRTKFLGKPGDIEKFWSGLEGSPLLLDFPLACDPSWREKAVPLAIHGDGTPVAGLGKAWGKMLDLYVFTSLLCNAVAKDAMFYLFAAYAHLMTKDSTKIVWEILSWSFQALASGRWPSTDHRGLPFPPHTENFRKAGTLLAGGFRGLVYCMSSDLDHNATKIVAEALVLSETMLALPVYELRRGSHVLGRVSSRQGTMATGMLD